MRKHTILILAACLAAQVLEAAPVTPGRALEIGKMILSGGQAKRGSGDVSIVWDGEFTDTRATESPAFYVIARDGGGFVIISGDDNVRPVLALSEEGRFETEDMPEHVQWWMERMKAYVRSTFVQTPLARQQWEALAQTRAATITGTVTEVAMHHTPEWSQSTINNIPIFNKFCPMDQTGTQLTITGCVATALGEVMTTLSGIFSAESGTYAAANMPTHATGKVGGYTPMNTSRVPADIQTLGATTYDWANLRTLTTIQQIWNVYYRNNASDQALLDNMAHLLADCGAIMQAEYGVKATSGVSAYIPRRMSEHFYMNKAASWKQADTYTASQWKQMLKADLDRWPVLYSGQSPSGGHAFVFDGYGTYQEEDVFYVNFGWGGYCNGYYYYDNLDAGNGDDYSTDCDAIFDFFPDAQQATAYPYELQFVALNDTYVGLTADSESELAPGKVFLIHTGGFKNTGTNSYPYPVGIFIQDKNGNGNSYYHYIDHTSSPLAPGEITYGSANIKRDIIKFGDKLAAKFYDGSSWIPIAIPKDGTIVGELPLTPGAFIKTEPSYVVGDYFVFQLMNYNCLYAGTQWSITDPNGSSTTMAQSAGQYQFTQSGKYKIVAHIKADDDSDIVENVVTYITVD